MPEFKNAKRKGMRSAEVNGALDQRPDLRLVKLADAAHNWTHLGEWHRRLTAARISSASFHAAEQLKAATDAACGENDLRGPAQYEKYRHLLRNEPGDLEPVRGLRYLHGQHRRRTRIREVLGYLRRNRHRMGSAEAAQCGLPIGSGPDAPPMGSEWPLLGGVAVPLSKTYRTEVFVPDDDIESAPGRAA